MGLLYRIEHYKACKHRRKIRAVGAYRCISHKYLSTLAFVPESLIVVLHMIDTYCAVSTAIINALGNKGKYYFVPEMIKYYLGKEPILKDTPIYMQYYEEDCTYVLDNLKALLLLKFRMQAATALCSDVI